jgi:hypothetical protein
MISIGLDISKSYQLQGLFLLRKIVARLGKTGAVLGRAQEDARGKQAPFRILSRPGHCVGSDRPALRKSVLVEMRAAARAKLGFF